MKRQMIFTVFLLVLAGAVSVFAQPSIPTQEQIRRDVAIRNQAVGDPANNPFNRGAADSPTGRMSGYGAVPGAEVRKYVLALQAETPVKILTVSDGDTFFVDDGKNKARVRVIGIYAPEAGQPGCEEAKKNLSDLLAGKKVVLKYSLNNLSDKQGFFLAKVLADGQDVALSILKNGSAWRYEKDKYFLEKKDDEEYARAEAEARAAKRGIWQNGKPQKPWEYKDKSAKKNAAGK